MFTVKMKVLTILGLTILLARPASSQWTLYSWSNSGRYNPSPAPGIGGDLSTFNFPVAKKGTAYPAFLTTISQPGLIGDLTGKTLSASINLSVTGNPLFRFGGQGVWNNCPVPANTRLYFSTNPNRYDLQQASQNPDDYWWSHAGVVNISAATGAATLTDTFDPPHWSNAKGQSAADPAHTPAFMAAVQGVRQIGVSFGGGCYFDVGIAVLPNTGTAQFHMLSFTAQ